MQRNIFCNALKCFTRETTVFSLLLERMFELNLSVLESVGRAVFQYVLLKREILYADEYSGGVASIVDIVLVL